MATSEQASGRTDGEEIRTHRSKERKHEDDNFVPVIVKRSDEARRHPDDTLERAVEEGLEQLRRPATSLALSSLAAGLILGFTAMSVAVATRFASQFELTLLTRALTAAVYPLGFVICVLSGTQLFTEHTATAVYPILDKRAPRLRLLRLWTIVIAGNLAGAAVSAGLLAVAEPVIQAREGYLEIAKHLVEFDAGPLLVSSLLAGWLMAQGAWLLLGAAHTSGQILSIYIVTFLIGVGGLHHSIAGSVELFTALLVGAPLGPAQVFRFLGCALLGNLIGGSMFVAVLNYAHIRGTQTESESDGS